jgi:hypothetical protein
MYALFYCKDVLNLLEKFEVENESNAYASDIEGFKTWLCTKESSTSKKENEPYWEGKKMEEARRSVISTSLVHLNRYAKSYSKSAILDSDFATQEDLFT